jgi:hypothetical protein
MIRPNAYEDWLSCRNTDEARSFLHLYPADEMDAEAFPLPPRAPKTKPSEASLLKTGSNHCLNKGNSRGAYARRESANQKRRPKFASMQTGRPDLEPVV